MSDNGPAVPKEPRKPGNTPIELTRRRFLEMAAAASNAASFALGFGFVPANARSNDLLLLPMSEQEVKALALFAAIQRSATLQLCKRAS